MKELCDEESENDLYLFDAKKDQIEVAFESPMRVLHLLIHYLMVFIKQYDSHGNACCELKLLQKEMELRGIFPANKNGTYFENLRTVVDQRQFRIKNGIITSFLKR